MSPALRATLEAERAAPREVTGEIAAMFFDDNPDSDGPSLFAEWAPTRQDEVAEWDRGTAAMKLERITVLRLISEGVMQKTLAWRKAKRIPVIRKPAR